jgi:PLD-like domain
LRSGDQLVVDLSRGAVKQGVTDPREIKRLIERGVEVFTRDKLHAKVVVIDDVVIAGSANVSQNARNYLGEAAILSTSPTAVRAAKQFVSDLFSEPVSVRYLEECIALYKPPIFKAFRTIRSPNTRRRRAKPWFIAGLTDERDDIDPDHMPRLEKEAEQELRQPRHSDVGLIKLPYRPQWFSDIRSDDWIVEYTTINNQSLPEVGPRAQVIHKRHYTTKAGKHRYVVLLERSLDGEPISMTAFRKLWRQMAPVGMSVPMKSRPIVDEELADAVLRLWTPRGKVSLRRCLEIQVS